MKSLYGVLSAFALSLVLVPPIGLAYEIQIAQGPAAAEQHLPGQWAALTPQRTTTVFIKLNGTPTKNADGSLSFTGRMWSEGTYRDGGADLSLAKLEDGKLALAYPAGTASLLYDGKTLTGHITYGQAVLQNMRFEKK